MDMASDGAKLRREAVEKLRKQAVEPLKVVRIRCEGPVSRIKTIH